MIDSTQLTGRESLDIIIRQTILIYRWAVYAAFGFIGGGFLIAAIADQSVDAEMALPADLLQQVFDLEASGFFGIGIGLMILTPIVMITSAAYTFLRAADRRYALITLTVAVILSLSIVISFVTG